MKSVFKAGIEIENMAESGLIEFQQLQNI